MLRVWTNGVDWVVARDHADVHRVLMEHARMEGVAGPYGKDEDWNPLRDDEVLIVPDEFGMRRAKYVVDWVRWRGRGHLCSSLW